MVITHRTTRCEGITKPVFMLGSNLIRHVREGRRALVRRHNKVGVEAITADHIAGMTGFAVGREIVSDFQQTRDELSIASAARLLVRPMIRLEIPGGRRRPAHHEASLGSRRNDHRVLHRLSLG
ncbi:Uncharacterised protein [Mycobacteroides abscessus subsp. abscessus]|nr:Uncharacterised protein [Mycobacteroides abscessus subsp. abscessus]SKT70797.1 Uncharacterised protein [Mycobacteroides abscessus subsp. abscessus]